MRPRSIFAIVLALLATAFAKAFASESRPSPDGRWLVAWNCDRPDSCTITLSRRADGSLFFTHRTNQRHIAAVWSADSNRCLVLDAPDNANSYLWLFRTHGRDVITEKLDYDKISERIEAAVPAAGLREPAVTRSGIDKIEWLSASEFRLHIIYNNVPVLVLVDVTKLNSPSVRVLPQR